MPTDKRPELPHAITAFSVSGFKSIVRRQSIQLKPLTILAGANSSGKSSIMQPLLLMKQTLDAVFDPGPLLLEGPNVVITSAEQLIPKTGTKRAAVTRLEVAFEAAGRRSAVVFRISKLGIELNYLTFSEPGGEEQRLSMEIPQALIRKLVPEHLRPLESRVRVERNRFLLHLVVAEGPSVEGQWEGLGSTARMRIYPGQDIEDLIEGLIHVPGARGGPKRQHGTTGIGPLFPGTFESYVASVLSSWQENRSTERLELLGQWLERLGLTWKVEAKKISDSQTEMRVGRLPQRHKNSPNDLVNIADHGFGTSQVLPVLVALLAADRQSTVYVEQPEVHLHPRAQVALASVLADAVRQGARMVIETHSSLLLRGLQTLVARGELSPDAIGLHWFTRDKNGATEVAVADLDEAGAFGDWPTDFDEVVLDADRQYLDAVEHLQSS